MFPEPSHSPSPLIGVNGIKIGLETSCPYFELTFPINYTQEEQGSLSADIVLICGVPDLINDHKAQYVYRTPPVKQLSRKFSTKKVPLPRPNWKNIPTGGGGEYLAGIEFLVSTSFRVTRNKGSWFKFSHAIAAVYIT